MKIFKHKKTGEIATYKDGIITSGKISFHIGVEPSSDLWVDVTKYPVGTKVIDTNPDTKGYVYEKLSDGRWKFSNVDCFVIEDSQIGEGKLFKLVERENKKDYEILNFYYKNIAGKGDNYVDPQYIWYETSKGSGKWSRLGHVTTPYDTEDIINNPNFGIHSIKRLSDGVIFTVGDRIDGSTYTNRTILSFNLHENTISIGQSKGITSLECAKHSKKQPLFKTEDGVDIFEGDIYYIVNTSYTVYHMRAQRKHIQSYPGAKLFSTAEAANEYRLLHKPCLSIKDIQPTVGLCNNTTYVDLNLLTKKLKELVKSKI